MKVIKIIAPHGCANGACPSLHLTDAGAVLVQGARLPANQRESLGIPDHEEIVAIPKAVFEDLLRQYAQ
jgi:hypothetical protein